MIAPGKGEYDEKGDRIIFTAYSHTYGKKEYASLIWMDKSGNWHRSENGTVNEWSSEGSAVVLEDRVRMFYRGDSQTIKYTDFVYDGNQDNYVRKSGSVEIDTGLVKTARCQLSAIRYSVSYQGKDVVLVSTPTGKNKRRENGKIYAFAVEKDKSLTLVSTYRFDDAKFAYSCLTELSDGNIAILYEREGGEIVFEIIPFEKLFLQ